MFDPVNGGQLLVHKIKVFPSTMISAILISTICHVYCFIQKLALNLQYLCFNPSPAQELPPTMEGFSNNQPKSAKQTPIYVNNLLSNTMPLNASYPSVYTIHLLLPFQTYLQLSLVRHFIHLLNKDLRINQNI